MRRIRYIMVAGILLSIQLFSFISPARGSAVSGASSSMEYSPAEKARRGAGASVFNDRLGDLFMDHSCSRRAVSLEGERIQSPLIMPDRIPAGSSAITGSRRKNMAVSIIASAVLPGLGEMYMYSKSKDISLLARAIGLFAVEGYLWYGYFDNHDRGKDFKRQYEEYGDAHWSEERFLEYHPICDDIGGCESWQQYNEIGSNPDYDYSSEYFYFFYTAKSVDTEEYYENMGKYDAFLYGWDDWNGEYLHKGGDPNYWTPHRTAYWDLRGESNKYLLRADYHVMGMIATRVISMVHAGWIAYSGSGSSDEWSLDIDKTPASYRCSLNYRF